jgi:hypothetical protein
MLPTEPEQAPLDTRLPRRIPGESNAGQRRPGFDAFVKV